MKWWPFDRTEEHRSYSNAAVDALLASASVATPEASATAAAVASVQAVAGVLASSVPSAYGDLLSPAFLADYASRMMVTGNAIYLIDVEDGIGLIPACAFDVGGGYRPSSWVYSLDLPRPSGDAIKRRVPAGGVVHVKTGATPASPWRGRSALERAGLTSGQLAHIERSLGLDSSVPTGGILPQPDGASAMAVAQANAALSQGKGALTLIETTAGGYGQGPTAAPRKDWEQVRFGPQVQQPNVQLRDSASNLIMASLGINSKIFDGDGASAQAAHRLMVTGVVQHLAALLEREVAVKLLQPLTLDLSPAGGYDVRGIGRALGSLVQAGLPLDQALRVAGIEASRVVRS